MSIILLFLHLSPLARPRPVNFILLWLDFLFNYEGRGRQYLKVITALLIGHPITKDVVGSRVTSETSEMQLESQTSERGTWNRRCESTPIMSLINFQECDAQSDFIIESEVFSVLTWGMQGVGGGGWGGTESVGRVSAYGHREFPMIGVLYVVWYTLNIMQYSALPSYNVQIYKYIYGWKIRGFISSNSSLDYEIIFSLRTNK